MYDAVEDPYCYEGTTVLKNRLDLRSQRELSEFETEIVASRSEEALPDGTLDYQHYKSIHHHLFQDVYEWAGQERTVRISKGGNMFCFPENIVAEATKLFEFLRRARFFTGLTAGCFAGDAARFIADLNAIHPFREGNGRTQLTFLTLLAEHAGHPLDLDQMDPDAMLHAMVGSFTSDEAELGQRIFELIRRS
ncbi:MAG: Fic family protein [Pseudorhodobacter sp.]|nr:Fic family protein [Pseudorhodobacter sp.]